MTDIKTYDQDILERIAIYGARVLYDDECWWALWTDDEAITCDSDLQKVMVDALAWLEENYIIESKTVIFLSGGPQ